MAARAVKRAVAARRARARHDARPRAFAVLRFLFIAREAVAGGRSGRSGGAAGVHAALGACELGGRVGA